LSSKLALTIGAVAALVFGLALLLLPEQMLAGFGLATPSEAQILSRDLGVTLIGLAILNWMAREATGTPLRAILLANLFIQVAELVVNGAEVATAILPAQAAGGLLIHLVLAVVFALPLRRVA
jgi:hypothetical protein